MQHIAHTLKHAWRSTEELNLSPQWLWIVDFNGFSIWNALHVSTSSATLQTFSNHYPERLGAVILLNPPSVFDILFTALKPFVDERTLSKVHIIRGDQHTINSELVKFGIGDPSLDDGGMAAWISECISMSGSPGNVPSDVALNRDTVTKIRLPGCAHGSET